MVEFTVRVINRHSRTVFLGIVAFVSLVWGAVNITQVPTESLWVLLKEVTIAALLVIGCSVLPAGFLYWCKSYRRNIPNAFLKNRLTE